MEDVRVNRIVITGGSGFIGTNAVACWVGKGWNVLSIDKKPPQDPAHREIWKQCDILDAPRLRELLVGFDPDYVLHLAAQADLIEKDNLRHYAANIEGVENFIDATRRVKSLRRVIFASTRMVCPTGYQPTSDEDYDPPNLYGESKMLGERIVRGSRLEYEWTIVRPTGIWGPWFDVPYKLFFRAIATGQYFNPGGFDPVKSLGFVGNSVHQLDKLFEAPPSSVNGRTIYLSDYPPLRVREWAELIRRSMKVAPVRSVPYPVLRGVALCGDVLDRLGWHRVPLTSFRLGNLITDMVHDTSAIENICGPLKYGVEEAVKMTVEWMSIWDGMRASPGASNSVGKNSCG